MYYRVEIAPCEEGCRVLQEVHKRRRSIGEDPNHYSEMSFAAGEGRKSVVDWPC